MISEKANNTGNADRLSREFFPGGRFLWHKSRKEVWDEMESRMEHRQPVRTVHFSGAYILSIAAGILILVGIGSFFRFYTLTITAPAGIHRTATLPDGTGIELNSVSTIRYYPYWWKFSRMVKLDGEAHFEVTPGKKFAVASANGTTEVLGTKFNIYSRKNDYQVTCLTGKVRVTSPTRKTVLLLPGSKAEIMENGEISVQEKIDTYPLISWRDNIFLFTAKPVGEVFAEIERQYNITIRSNLNDKTRYSGNFTKEQNVEEILGYICPALDSKYIRKSAGLYVITQEIE